MAASSTLSGAATLLTDGVSRDIDGAIHHWQSDGLTSYVQLEWAQPVHLSKVEIKCDSNVKRNILMREDSKVNDTFRNDVPDELLKCLHVEALLAGGWAQIASLDNNRTRLIRLPFDQIETTAIRVSPTATHGRPTAKLFEIRCYA